MKRREFITVIGVAATWPFAARAQQSKKIPRLCFLTFDPGTLQATRFAFFEGLRDLGYVDGQSINIDYLSAEGRGERFPALAAECLRRQADIIAVSTTPAAQAAKNANRPRGHTSLSGADDAQIAVMRDKEGIVTATVEHMKDAESGTVLGEKVALGTDDDGDPMSSCIVVPTETGAQGPKLSKVQRFAFDLLKKLVETEPAIAPPAEAKLPAGARACLSETWRKEFYATYPAETRDTKKKALFRATLALEEEGLIGLRGDYVWLPVHHS